MNFFAIYIKLLHVQPLSKKKKKIYSIEEERIFDTPELMIGQITALKLPLYSDREAAD